MFEQVSVGGPAGASLSTASSTGRGRRRRAAGRSARRWRTCSSRTGACRATTLRPLVPDDARARRARRHAPGSGSWSLRVTRAPRRAALLPVPGISSFLQLNVRTYVRGRDELPGVWFSQPRRVEPSRGRGGAAPLSGCRASTRAWSLERDRRLARRRVRADRRARPRLQRPLPRGGEGVRVRAGLARGVPRRALLPLRDRPGRPAAPRRDPPRAVVGCAAREAEIELATIAPLELSGSAAVPRRGAPGPRRLAARSRSTDALRTLRAVTPQRRTALRSVLAAAALIGLKLGTGLATGSLGLLSEALHSGTDLVAALLTFFAVGVAGGPADRGHQYGHGKAEHLAALGEGAILVLASLAIVWRAIVRLDRQRARARARGVVRARRDRRRDRRSTSAGRSRRPAPRAATRAPRSSSNALHFASDLAGSVAVLVGLLLVRAGYRERRLDRGALRRRARARRGRAADAAERRRAHGPRAGRRRRRRRARAIAAIEPAVELRRLRMRQAAGRQFADVVIGVSFDSAVGQGHAAADAVERAVQAALPEARRRRPRRAARRAWTLRERAHAAALGVPQRARGAQRQRRLGRLAARSSRCT